MYIKITSTALLLCLSITAQADQSKLMTKQQFIDFIGKNSASAMCDRDPRFKKCMSFSAQQCEAVISKVTPICQNVLKQNMPDTISKKEDFVKYGIMFSQCAGAKMIDESGIDIAEVDRCFSNN